MDAQYLLIGSFLVFEVFVFIRLVTQVYACELEEVLILGSDSAIEEICLELEHVVGSWRGSSWSACSCGDWSNC